MPFQLAGVGGEKKGSSWALSLGRLCIGRDEDNDIVLDDPVVSRRHCCLLSTEDTVRIEDLGARHPALVNGLPAVARELCAGDELTIGQQRFLLTAVEPTKPSSLARRGAPDTQSWSNAEPVLLSLSAARPPTEGRPRTLQDLVALHDLTREFSSCISVAELLALLERRLTERLRPQRMWVALGEDEDDLVFHLKPRKDAAPPVAEIRRAFREGRGLLAPRSKRTKGGKALVLSLVSPLVAGHRLLGVLAVETGPPHGAFTEDDLRFLVLLTQSVGPLLWVLLDAEQLRRDNEALRARLGESLVLKGTSRVMSRVRAQVAKASQSNLTVLITGETGTGKELAARLLHGQSRRNAGPFVVVNCAAIPHDLFESQFFGYERGAFTGASQAFPGLLSQAHGGTLFLDEVADLSLDNQARILRCIEYGAFRRIGAQEESQIDMRVVAATNKDVKAAVRGGDFREDLLHRLNGFTIHIPPLRERPSDVPVLAEHFFQMAREQAKRPLQGFADDVMPVLRGRPWPGNVRELRNCILRGISLAREDQIRLRELLPGELSAAGPAERAEFLSLAEMEKRHIAHMLERCGGNVKEAAGRLQIARSTLYKKMTAYELG